MPKIMIFLVLLFSLSAAPPVLSEESRTEFHRRQTPVEYDRDDQGPLFNAVALGDPAKVALALKGPGVDINFVDDDNGTPLSQAVTGGRRDVVWILLQEDALVDLPGKSGDTPLAIASRKGLIGIIRLLVAAGADVNRVNMKDGADFCGIEPSSKTQCEVGPGTALQEVGSRTMCMSVDCRRCFPLLKCALEA